MFKSTCLTWWRVAAFIWMVLVALGLVLIVARIALNRSNGWLIRANLITLTATLYICSLVNFAAIIADYNVSHSREAAGKGVWIDMNYLFHLGPQALPAIDRAIALRGFDPTLVSRRGCLVEQQRREMASWRSWGLRSWRLQRTLDAQPARVRPQARYDLRPERRLTHRILIVDDDLHIREVIRVALKKAGMTVFGRATARKH